MCELLWLSEDGNMSNTSKSYRRECKTIALTWSQRSPPRKCKKQDHTQNYSWQCHGNQWWHAGWCPSGENVQGLCWCYQCHSESPGEQKKRVSKWGHTTALLQEGNCFSTSNHDLFENRALTQYLICCQVSVIVKIGYTLSAWILRWTQKEKGIFSFWDLTELHLFLVFELKTNTRVRLNKSTINGHALEI